MNSPPAGIIPSHRVVCDEDVTITVHVKRSVVEVSPRRAQHKIPPAVIIIHIVAAVDVATIVHIECMVVVVGRRRAKVYLYLEENH